VPFVPDEFRLVPFVPDKFRLVPFIPDKFVPLRANALPPKATTTTAAKKAVFMSITSIKRLESS
jgi:hypothetical protein